MPTGPSCRVAGSCAGSKVNPACGDEYSGNDNQTRWSPVARQEALTRFQDGNEATDRLTLALLLFLEGDARVVSAPGTRVNNIPNRKCSPYQAPGLRNNGAVPARQCNRRIPHAEALSTLCGYSPGSGSSGERYVGVSFLLSARRNFAKAIFWS